MAGPASEAGHELRARLSTERAPFARGDRVAVEGGERSLVVKREVTSATAAQAVTNA